MLAESYDPDYLDGVLPALPGRLGDAVLSGRLKDVSLTIDESEPPVRLEGHALEVWEGKQPAFKEDGTPDNSETLYKIGRVLAEAGASKGTIARALQERDGALGFHKYADRRDSTEYVRVASKAIAEEGGVRGFPGSRSLNIPGTEGTKQDGGAAREVVVVSFGEIAEPAPREWLVEDLIPKGAPSKLYGDGGLAKSYLALHLATTVAASLGGWLGHGVKKCPVLYLDFELDVDEQARRAFRIARGLGMERPPEDLYYICALGHTAQDAFQAALDLCHERSVGLMVLDSENPALQGDAETAKDVIGFYRNYLDPFREVGTSVLTIDHQAKLVRGEKSQHKRAFGSVFKENLSRSVMQVDRNTGEEGSLIVNLRHTKSNFGPRREEISVQLTFDEDEVRVEKLPDLVVQPEPASAREEVLEALRRGGAMYPDEIAEATGLEKKTVQNRLSELRKASLVVDTGETHGRSRQVAIYSQGSQPTKGTGA
jgi:DNA-binding transcriptional ArsR family regulator